MQTLLIDDLSYEEYDAIQAERATTLKAMSISAKHYRHRRDHKGGETRALKLGKTAHCAVLEPLRFLRDHVLWDQRNKAGTKTAPRSGAEWKAFQAKHASQVILLPKEYAEAIAIRDAVRGDPVAMKYLGAGKPEVTMLWPMLNRQCKARPDWITNAHGRPTLVGLKSARDVREYLFGTQAAKLHYHVQWAWYFDGYSVITGEAPRMIEISVENVPPYDVVVYEIPNEIIVEGRQNYMEMLKSVNECDASGMWPGIAQGNEQTLTFPSWAYSEPFDDDISGLGLLADGGVIGLESETA
jgi:hypothetical protein